MPAFWVLFIAVCVLLAGYYAGTETGFYRLNRVRLRFRVKQGDASARRLGALVRRGDEFLITTLVGNNLCVFLATFICTRLYEDAGYARAEFLATLTLVGPIFLFGEVLQKEIFRRAADVLMYRAVRLLGWSAVLFRPAVLALKQVQRFWTVFARHGAGDRDLRVERQRLHHFFSESAQEGTLSAYQHAMAQNVMKLQGTPVERVMIPQSAVVSIRTGGTLEDCRQLARTSPYRRFPVADEHGKLLGVVNVLELLAHREGPFDLKRYLRQPASLRADTNIIDALRLLRRSRQPMGFVTDAGGNVLGIVTVKDLVEEIVGELAEW